MIAPATQQVHRAGEARNRFEELTARLVDCQSREHEAAQELKTVIAALIDAPNDDRPDLIDQHAAISAVRAALADELSELGRQIRESYVLYFRLLERESEAAYQQAQAEANAARKAYNDVLDERSRHYNGGFRVVASAAHTQRSRELESRIGQLKVDSIAAAQAQDQASYELERARGRTARAVRAVEENKPLLIGD